MATWAERQKAPESGQIDYEHRNGARLRVFASGRRCWFIRGRIRRADGEGEQRFVVLGDGVTMDENAALKATAEAREAMRAGKDPAAERLAALKAADAGRKTFLDVATEWSDDCIARKKWRKNTARTRHDVFNGPRLAMLRDKPIGKITTRDVDAVASRIAKNSMQATLGPVRSVFKFAVQQGYIAASPFKAKIEKSEGDAEPLIEFHEGKAPDFSELVAALNAIDTAEKQLPVSPWWDIYRVCIASGLRPSAIIGLRWTELHLDGDAPNLTLPSERSKIKTDSVIPLSRDCAALLRAIPKVDDGLVWPGRDGKNPRKYPTAEPLMISQAMAAAGYPKGWRPGRARDSVASWLEFQTDATERAMALLLNHKPPADNTRRRHYARISAEHQARVLIERWAAAVRDARELKKD